MKKLLLTAVLLIMTMSISAQKKFDFKFYGFVRNYACFDTRESLTSNSEQFYYIPKDENLDANGDDLNQNSNMMLLSITTRLGLNITGPEFLGAKTSAKIESDFAGFGTSNTVLRIRQAYAKMDWTSHAVLVGQAWHPMMGDMMPDVFSLETGAPFTPFSRTPQVRYDYKIKNYTLSATALYQYQYTSSGPDKNNLTASASSFDYARNAVVPEIYLQAMYKGEKFQVGAGVDILNLKPRTEGKNADGNTVKVSENVLGFTPTLFASYKEGNFGIKGRVTYAQNAAHLSMMSGYAVSELNNGEAEYSTLNSVAAWVDATYKQPLKKGSLTYCLFGGYSKNLGSNDDIDGSMMYVRGYKNIDHIWRVAPSILYTHNAMAIGVEYNPTTVAYGTMQSDGTVENTHNVTNHRICAMLKYTF